MAFLCCGTVEWKGDGMHRETACVQITGTRIGLPYLGLSSAYVQAPCSLASKMETWGAEGEPSSMAVEWFQ